MKKYKEFPPDGGFGWKVAYAVAFINIFNQGLISVYGLLFGNRLISMGYGAASVAVLMSTNSSVGNLSGIFVGPLHKLFSNRSLIIGSIIFSSFGMILSGLSTNLSQILLGYGVFTGIGLGLIQAIGFVTVKSYFTSKSLDAVSITAIGTSFGQICLPQLITVLIELYDYDGTMLILGALCLNGLVAAIYFDPVENHMIRKEILTEYNDDSAGTIQLKLCIENEEDKSKVEDKETTVLNNNSLELSKDKYVDAFEKDRLEELNKKPKSQEKPSFVQKLWTNVISAFDLDLLKNFSFINVLIGVSISYTSHMIFSSFFPLSLEDIPFNNSQIANCLTVLSTADICGRFLIPKVTRYLKLTSRGIFALGLVWVNFFRSVVVLQSSLPLIFFLCCLCGFGKAITVTTINLVVADATSREKAAGAVGISMVSKAVFIFSIGELLAVLRDEFDSYIYPIIIINSFAFVVMFGWLIEFIFTRKRNKDGIIISQTEFSS